MLGYELFAAYPDIFCFATTREGGYSSGAYGTFNCSPFSGDNEEDVQRNQGDLRRALGANLKGLFIPQQVHGTEIGCVDASFLSLSLGEQQEKLNGVDAIVTNEPGCCICVSTADCVPLLVYDRVNCVAAAIHAGWRGTVERIVTKTLAFMQEKFGTQGKDVLVAIGPSISLESFEVGQEVYDTFREKGFNMSGISIWKAETQKHHIDLWEANRVQLREFGIPEDQIECAGICTYLRHAEFFSARRLGIKSGRMLSGIMINKK